MGDHSMLPFLLDVILAVINWGRIDTHRQRAPSMPPPQRRMLSVARSSPVPATLDACLASSRRQWRKPDASLACSRRQARQQSGGIGNKGAENPL